MILNEFNLHGQVAIVTGAGSPRGKAIVTALAEAGANVVAVDRRRQGADEAAALAKRLGSKGDGLAADVSDATQAKDVAQWALSERGRIDILVNNEEVRFAKPLLEITPQELRRVLDLNLSSAFLMCQAVGPHMLEKGNGKIVNVTSGMGARGLSQSTLFSASKAGLIQLTSALSVEWGPQGVKVNAVGPMWFEGEGVPPGPPDQDPVLRYIPIRRRGRWEELASVVVFLCCDGCHFLTGKTIFADGGVMSHA